MFQVFCFLGLLYLETPTVAGVCAKIPAIAAMSVVTRAEEKLREANRAAQEAQAELDAARAAGMDCDSDSDKMDTTSAAAGSRGASRVRPASNYGPDGAEIYGTPNPTVGLFDGCSGESQLELVKGHCKMCN